MKFTLILSHIGAAILGVLVSFQSFKIKFDSSENIFDSIKIFHEVRLGQTRDELVGIMGEPKFEYQSGGKSILGYSDFTEFNEIGLNWPAASPRHDAPFIVVLDEMGRVTEVRDNASTLIAENLKIKQKL